MARGKKDPLAAGGSGDPAVEEEAAAMEVEEQEEVEEQDKGDEEEEWKEEDEEEEEEEWEDDEDEEEEEEEADEATEEPPKLAEGFYEIETIRRRRLRKGQTQYLVKWRGWPESANTWEPAENLKACSDFVEAFEQRQQPRSYGKRKRRRKNPTTPVVSPNPSHGTSGTGRGRGRPRRSESDPRSPSNLPAPERKMLPLRTSSRRATDNSNKNLTVRLDASVNVVGQQMLGQSATTQEGSSDVLSAGFPSKRTDISAVVQQQDEHQRVNGLSKVENSVQAPPPPPPAPASPSQDVQVTGAKKRKRGFVRRFTLGQVLQQQGEVQNGRIEKQPGNEGVDTAQGEAGDRTNESDYANRLHITRIIKPVRYHATMTDHEQQVSITFKAIRSDGQEVLVDDKELKSNNPLVLIKYYEQHLRYNPTS